jgi:geranylgeranyl pyrophosphate synthase
MVHMDNEAVREYLRRRAAEIDAVLVNMVPMEECPPTTLHRAMRYSLLGGGKRLRPTLVLTAGEAVGGHTADLLVPACAVEMLHTYSLIHDDLPAMDNDDMRRGRPTCHKAFGQATAILAGDALQAQAFLVLAGDETASHPTRRLRAIREIAKAVGPAGGMVGGQVVDLESQGHPADATVPRTLWRLHWPRVSNH